MAIADPVGTFTITYDGCSQTYAATDVTITSNFVDSSGWTNSQNPSTQQWNTVEVSGSGYTAVPYELRVCQICGEEGVIVFCDECKNLMNWARKKWAEAAMKELEDDLS